MKKSDLLLLLLSIVVFFLAGEVVVRLFVPQYRWDLRDPTAAWAADPGVGWVNRPLLDLPFRDREGREARFRTNGDGIMPGDAVRERSPGTMRVMLFGDSTVVGWNVRDGQRIHRHLERLLESGGRRVEVLNAGVQGYSTDQSLLLMKKLLPLYRPDIVAYCFCTNDLQGNGRRIEHSNPKPVFVIDERGDLREIPPELEDSGIRGLSERRLSRALGRSALYGLLRPGINRVRSLIMGWEGRAVPDSVSHRFYYEKDYIAEADDGLLAPMLEGMKAAAAAHGAKFFFYSHPALYEVWDPYARKVEPVLGLDEAAYERYAVEEYLAEVAADGAIEFHPLIDHFLANLGRGPFHLLPRDPHCNGKGYEVTAESLGNYLHAVAAVGGS